MVAKVKLVGYTHFTSSDIREIPWEPDYNISGAEALSEFAGRACYQSWDKPNKATATNRGYLNHILEVSHLSVLEHGSASFYLEGISRSLTHELIRHRHFSYSQLSQRYVESHETELVMPPDAEKDEYLQELITEHRDRAISTYIAIAERVEQNISDEPGTKTEKRKRARQTARAVLANYSETKVVMTGNHRAWRHFIQMRASAAADTEIRRLAIQILNRLQQITPSIYNDFIIAPYEDEFIAFSLLGKEAE